MGKTMGEMDEYNKGKKIVRWDKKKAINKVFG